MTYSEEPSPGDMFHAALSQGLFLSKKAAVAASEFHRLYGESHQRTSRAPLSGSGTLHVHWAGCEEVLEQHAETGSSPSAASD